MRKKQRFLFITVFVMILANLHSQQISFDVDNILAGPAIGNWMFDSDDPNFFTHDGDPFTPDVGGGWWHNRAYVGFNWNEAPPQSTSLCLSEALNVLDGTENVTLFLDSFVLTTHEHINTVNPNLAWHILGQAGDKRDYMCGVGEIYVDGELKLRAIDCRLTVETPYPTAAEMQNILAPWGGQNWQNNVGSGEEVTGSGWGTIDVANSDPAWVAEFDPLGWGMLQFDVGTFNHVIQGEWGYYDFEITVEPAQHFEREIIIELPEGRGTVLDFSEVDVVCDFAAGAVSGGAPPDADTLRSVMVNQIKTAPGGNLPDDIESLAPLYWDIGTNLSSYTADVTFDLEEIGSFADPADLRILKRNHENADWQIWSDYTLVDASHLRANNVSDFSEWTIGSTQDDPLPVELSTFSAVYLDRTVSIMWTTEFEDNNAGWNIYRGNDPEAHLNDATVKINNMLIPGSGNSLEPTEYEFTDEIPLEEGKTYWYWLEDVSTSGAFQIHEPASVHIPSDNNPAIPQIYGLQQNYPNPFNPTTIIDYRLKPEIAENSEIIIYNPKGQVIRTYKDLAVNANDTGSVIWNGKNNSGNKVASGIYFYKLSDGVNSSELRKMILVK